MSLQTIPQPTGRTGAIVGLIRRILRENGRDYVGLYTFSALCLLVVAATTGSFALLMRYIIDDIFFAQRADLILPICGSVVAVFVLRGFATYGQSVTMARIGNNLIARYQTRIFDHLMKMGIGYFADRRSGALAAQINENVLGVRDLVGLTLTAVARDFMTLVFLIAAMLYQDPVLSLISFLIGPR